MHKFRSKRSVRRLKMGGLAFILFILCILSLPYFLWKAVDERETASLIPLFAAIGITVFMGIYFRVIAANVRCPLCHGTLLVPRKTGSNRKVTRTFGSYRMTVILTSLFQNRLRCTYCGEPVACKEQVRQVPVE